MISIKITDMKTTLRAVICLCAVAQHSLVAEELPADGTLMVRRLEANPIIHADLSSRIGRNIQGPSMIRVPDWLQNPLGKYYLYFADHKGKYIRLAYADKIVGPWKVHEPGTLQLEQSHFRTEPAEIPPEVQKEVERGVFEADKVEGVPERPGTWQTPHIASPDVHVRDDRHEIVMYFHGLEGFRFQRTRVATSKNGLDFKVRKPLVSRPYLRAFRHDEQWYGIAMPGIFYRSKDGISEFEESDNLLFPSTMRHSAVWKRGDILYVFWTRVGDAPEHILLSKINLKGDWSTWSASAPVSVLRPEKVWEGAQLPLVPSVRSAINIRVNQVRDPAIFLDGSQSYLLYSIAGEAGNAIAEIEVRE